ncbi:MAG TPA: Crp/Fnr family transcriptional regulator [Terriglobales bacterium]
MTAITVFICRKRYHNSMESAIHQSCFDCILRPDRLFCDLPADALQAFDAIKSVSRYPRGSVLFHEGHPARAVFVLCEGRAKLSVCSEGGKRLTLRIAGPGEVLGMSAALSGSAYEVTAESLDHARVAVVRRKELLKFLRTHRDACMQVVHLLSQDLHTAYDRVRSVGLVRTRKPRVARVH